MINRTKLSKLLAYLLRHNPMGMEMSPDGFVRIEELLQRVMERYPEVTEAELRSVIETDPKGRYELRGDRVRARYGHSLPVSVELPPAQVERLYHGTTPQAAQKILSEGLKPKGRQKVHLSASVGGAVEVGKRRCKKPAVLEVDVEAAMKAGVRILQAGEKVYVADEIPARFIKLLRLFQMSQSR
jgi:putative RNA 2'-phosphotransferase